MNFKSLLPLLFFLLVYCQLFSQSEEIDVLHYQFQLTLSDDTNQIKGESNVQLRFLKETATFHLDLVAEDKGKGMKVTEVWAGEDKLAFKHEGESLRIRLLEQAKQGSETSIRIHYEGVPGDGLIISKNIFGDRTFFGDNWPNRAHHWLPVIDHPADKATVEFIVTAPAHYQVIGNGQKIEESYLDNDHKLTHWRSSTVLPTKVMVIGAARFATHYEGQHENIPVSSWVYPQNRKKGFHDYALALPVLTYFTSKIGPYPYVKLANVQSKTRYGGMENASNIFYSETSVTGDQAAEELIAHEIAHQWFGNSASERDWHHIWLSEGFATYFASLYMAHAHGLDTLYKGMEADRQQILEHIINAPNSPIVDTSITNLNALLNANSYEKGGWVLHMLRHEVGETAFWEGIREYYEQYQFSNALSEDFQAVMEMTSGKDLEVFFRQWLYQPGMPKIEGGWKYDPAKGEIILNLKQTQTHFGPYQLKLELLWQESNMTEPHMETLLLNKEQQAFHIKCPRRPMKVVLDPHHWILMESTFSK